ncbi:MAG: hypothetical protein U0869_01855 [Chloroflexota bacterium]
MTPVTPGTPVDAGTAPAEDAAIQVDTYLDELLATRQRHLAPSGDLPADLERTARLVREALVRFHPSFRFEEELAARLRAVADGAARAGALVRFPVAPPVLATADAAAAEQPAHDHPRVRIGGAIASGVSLASGLSLAAGMLLARRRKGRWARIV